MAGHPGDVRDERREDPASAAVTDLFRCHHLELVRLALLMTGDLAAAEDVVQDAFGRTRHEGAPWNLSWAGSRKIAFLWEGALKTHSPRLRTGYRLLDVTGPGGDLLAAGPVVQVRPNPGHDIPAAFVTPDGRAFVTSSMRVIHGRDNHVTVTAKIIMVSARTGRVQRVLYTESGSGVPRALGRAGALDEQRCTVLALDRTGQHPLIQCFVMGRFSFGTLAGGHLAPMAGLPNTDCVRECRGPLWGDATW